MRQALPREISRLTKIEIDMAQRVDDIGEILDKSGSTRKRLSASPRSSATCKLKCQLKELASKF